MPKETFQGLLLSVGPEAVQHFVALLHCSWYQLHGEVARVIGMGQEVRSPCVVVVKPCDWGDIRVVPLQGDRVLGCQWGGEYWSKKKPEPWLQQRMFMGSDLTHCG